ncbi:DUF982 domain-containing protein [Mesorhizobium sp. CA5]|uniref:DUF982 domain-containing protein n=1 Tax=Mesorhizobium sp. CA5 TaxID=2876638 RepID=UPI001CD07782|nr:DUF982 domain-containing protein [Mesorhizobium sp. CA5]MBZ9840905.1 DUF982 domain-containing protein [Mesorhizobium sp. CA5]
MIQGWFSRPVEVAVGVSGSIRHISNAEQAVELLTGQWRDAGSALHGAALRACRRAIPRRHRGGQRQGGLYRRRARGACAGGIERFKGPWSRDLAARIARQPVPMSRSERGLSPP